MPAGNSRFRSLGVRAGDILQYFVKPDETVDPDSQRSGMSRQKPLPMKVAQVIDDNTLLTDSSLNQEVDYPAKIEIWRNIDDRITDINDALVKYHIHRLPALGWEPAPDDNAMQQVSTWLNQWIRQSGTPPDWKRDPMLDALPADLAAAEGVKSAISAAISCCEVISATRKQNLAGGSLASRYFALGARRRIRQRGPCRCFVRLDDPQHPT